MTDLESPNQIGSATEEAFEPATEGAEPVNNDSSSPQDENADSNEDDNEEIINGDTILERIGTTSSARFNILSTMVGGGSLSLPLAFSKSGNALMGPLLLLVTAVVTEFCFRVLVRSSRSLHPVDGSTISPGVDSFESIAAVAFGPKALLFSKTLVVLMCFFGTVGYAVLLRDMLEPITVALYHQDPTRWQGNSVMVSVVFLVTPLCTLKTLTALKRFGAFSMFSVVILGSCVLFRSLECNLWHIDSHWTESFRIWPEKWKDVLDVIPLYISCYVCHYNILTVHNELRKPSENRVSWWLRSTTWSATIFYLVLGFSGSAFSKCSPKEIQPNILLNFDDGDPLLLVGRMCLATTITLAFPMLTIPARDIVLPSIMNMMTQSTTSAEPSLVDLSESPQETLAEPLLSNEQEETTPAEQEGGPLKTTLGMRLGIAMLLFWTATGLACCVDSIDIVWDLLGSSLSIILSYLIPCGSYLIIMKQQQQSSPSRGQQIARIVAWMILAVTGPLMFVSTGNAIHTTFFQKSQN